MSTEEWFYAIVGLAIVTAMVVVPAKLLLGGLESLSSWSARRRAARLEKEFARTEPKRERSFLKNCTYCEAFCLTLGYRDRLGRTYCSRVCAQWVDGGPRAFCEKCLTETRDESTGNLQQINGIGTSLMGADGHCQQCSSVVQRVWITFLFLPILPRGQYRIIRVSRHEFLSRRLR
jgi:hypothetical protein